MKHLTLAAFSLLALSAATPAFAQSPPLLGPKMKVTASFSIIGDMVKTIGGDKVDVVVFVGPNGDAHEYQPKPSDARTLTRSDLVIMNGLGFDTWVKKLVGNSGYKGKIAYASQGVNELIIPETKEHDDHKDGDHHKEAHDHGFKNAKGQMVDPHAWHDPANARIYAQNITNELAARDQANAEFYKKNGADYIAKIDEQARLAKTALAKIPADQRQILTSHDAFGYFARAYGLTLHAAQGISTDSQPSAAHIASLIDMAKAKKIKAIFVENMTNSNVVQQIASESGASVGGTLYADALDDVGRPAGTFLGMMAENARIVTAALTPPAPAEPTPVAEKPPENSPKEGIKTE